MNETFHILIQTPDTTLYEGQASSLLIETEGGQLEMFPHHANLVGTIGFTMPRVRIGSGDHVVEHVFAVRSGTVHFDTETNTCRILVTWGQPREEVVHETILEYLRYVEEKLANKENLNPLQIKYLDDQAKSLREIPSITFKQ